MAFKFNPFTGNFDIVEETILFDTETTSGTANLEANKTYLVDTSGGTASLTLPTPADQVFVRVKDASGNANTNNITIVRNGSEDIDGTAANYTMDSDLETKVFVSDGTDWFVF